MFWHLIEIFLLMIDIFLLENDLIKFNRKKSIQQKKTYQKISYYLNRIMSKENFAHIFLIFWKAQKVTKTASPGHKNDFFHQNYFFFSGSHPRQLFFAKKRTHFGQVQPPEPCVEKKPAYRGSPPCTIFLTSSEQRNIVQLCTRVRSAFGNVFISFCHFQDQWCVIRKF